MQITVHANRPLGPLPINWRSTGFTPAKWLLNPDMQQTLAFVGAVPQRGVRYVRIHFLLDLLKVEQPFSRRPQYDWSDLDRGLDVLVRNRLAPFFELMGKPAPQYHNFLEDRQARAWRRLVRDLALHCMERYGRREVESWYFETWNEPDVGWWTQGEEAFCRYYDACSEGLREANPKLRMGGPGTCCQLSNMLKVFLAHCDKGRNYFTGQRGVRLDFISVHEKGAGANKEDIVPDTVRLCDREGAIVAYIRKNHPRLADVPFMNNECDPIVGWGDIHTWHAKPYYAAQICRSVGLHLTRLVDGLGVRYALLGNDNGFLGTWGQRTHLARFGDNEQLIRGEFEMVKKPALNVMTALALLGPTRLACEVEGRTATPQELGALATRSARDQVAILIYHSRDRIMSSGSARVHLDVRGLPFAEGMLAHYRIDDEHGNPFGVWEQQGARTRPTPEQFAALRAHHELTLLEEPRAVAAPERTLALDFDLPLHAVSLLLFTRRPAQRPARVGELRFEKYKGLHGRTNVLVLWEGVASRALRTYEVLHAPSRRGPFKRLNAGDLLDTAYLHVLAPGEAPGVYRVRAVDYWGRGGK